MRVADSGAPRWPQEKPSPFPLFYLGGVTTLLLVGGFLCLVLLSVLYFSTHLSLVRPVNRYQVLPLICEVCPQIN